MVVLHSDLRWAIQIAARTFCYFGPARSDSRPDTPASVHTPARSTASNWAAITSTATDKPSICTADELHYVSVRNSDWRLALWRYKPPPKAPRRNHPLLLLSGVGTNAIGFDLSPESSFARHMSSQGFDTWVLEFRGAGLSTAGDRSAEILKPVNAISEQINSTIKNESIEQSQNIKSNVLPEIEVSSAQGSVEAAQNSSIARQIRDLSQRLINIIEEGQRSVSPPFLDLQENLFKKIEDLRKQLDLIGKYDWDFDHYLEEDIPAAMEYVRIQCKPKDGKLLAIGHSMGGILLYAMLSRNGFEGRDSRLASVITLASSLDYTTSRSSLKLLLPLADPAQALNVPVIPMGLLLAAAYPLASRPPYALSWLNPLISAQHMDPELLEKFVLNNFCTVPAKLLLQLTTAFREGGLSDRSGNFFYKDHLHKSNVPVLALAGDRDRICPPEAVYETVKLIPKHLVSYKVFGEPNGPHYAHYDLVGGPEAAYQVYPFIINFLGHHDVI
ncbi:alpha/beta hydrolase family protein [Actinidia rufa]|uniref:Alpha/beta hydrolase family protein n=1 Tax=Actinidia rufa TaxID=165716 RepID=A0A7J0GN49_9ERIC|nr:alpha/beta hydrolase family protein [Actinidia rufa]